MKKIFKYFGVFALILGALASCKVDDLQESADLGLGIKVFFPTKVIAGQDITINGSGFSDATEIVFPENVTVTDFEIVGGEMIRVTTPSGISSDGGKIIVRTATEEAESALPFTVGKPSITGYSLQPGESIQGGQTLTVYGTDLEFIEAVEFLDADGEPNIVTDDLFYRKGTSNTIIIIPQDIYTGTFAGTIYTCDGKSFTMPEFAYEPAPKKGGHYETVKTTIWENDGTVGEISWGGDYRFSNESNSTGEEIYAIPDDIWEKMMSGSFYLLAQGSDWVQMRITTGWWSTTWTGADITTGDDRIIDNGDGTYYIEINFEGDPILDVIDAQHLLLTGGGYTPIELYFTEEVWVGDDDEPKEVVIWENDGTHGQISWGGEYRFGLEGNDGNNECIATFSQDVWDKIKTGSFYLLAEGSDWVQMRITTGWWSTTWTGADITTGDDRIIDNGDGTYYIEINFEGDPILDVLDAQHLLFTGGGYTPLKLYFMEGGSGTPSGPTKNLFWEGDPDAANCNWDGAFRFGLEGNDGNNECIATFAQDVWDKLKASTFYVTLKGDTPQIRVTSGWWTTTWTGADIQPGNDLLVDNGDGTWTLTVTIGDDPLLEYLDAQHLLFTGSGYTPYELYFME